MRYFIAFVIVLCLYTHFHVLSVPSVGNNNFTAYCIIPDKSA